MPAIRFFIEQYMAHTVLHVIVTSTCSTSPIATLMPLCLYYTLPAPTMGLQYWNGFPNSGLRIL